MDNEKFSTLMYWMTKRCANGGWTDWLEDIGLTAEDWEEIKNHLVETYGIKTYI